MEMLHGLASSDFMPHGHCYLWIPGLVWLQVLANLAIGLAYVAISGTLVALTRKLRGVPFHTVYLAFGLFIVSCGVTHFMDVVTVWKPVYWADGWIRAFTAFVSVGTAIYLVALSPSILGLVRVLAQERQVSREQLERTIEERDRSLAREASARKEAEERGRQLDAAYADLDALFAHAPVGLVLFDREGRYRRVNRALAEGINGLPAEAHLGKRQSELFPNLSPDREAAMRTVLETGQPIADREITGESAAWPGEQRTWNTSYFPVRDRSGQVIGMGNTVVDVTAEKRTAREREKLLGQLQQSMRFSELFVGMLGHDLRNPLSAIGTSAQHLLRRDPEEKSGPAKRILTSAARMSRMIDQILDFTRARLGAGIPLQPRPVDLVPVLKNAFDELATTNPSAKLDLGSTGDTRGQWDEDRLAQVASNLIGNALQHGDPAVPLQVRVDGSAPDAVIWTVHNQGSVPPEVLAVIFEPFRGSLPRSGKARGLGLGLYITQQIVAAHGGTIEVASSPEQGTTFSVRLPRRAVREGA